MTITKPSYADCLSADVASRLAAANEAGLKALRGYLKAEQAVAFLGAGASVPLYPLWSRVIADLVDAAAERGLKATTAETLRDLADEHPDAVIELVRRQLGGPRYQAVLRDVFRIRRDPLTGATWTPIQELVCRCAFRAVVTTNYDPGILNAKMHFRSSASGTGFTSWTDETGVDEWLTGELFAREELPVLYAHGHNNQPEAIVLATTEYRRAYAGKLSRVLAHLVESSHLVWIGFSFADARIAAVLREIAEHAGTRHDPGRCARHVAVMPWDTGRGHDPQVLRSLVELQYGADLVLYPVIDGDHSPLQALLADLVDERYPTPVLQTTVSAVPSQRIFASQASGVCLAQAAPVKWVPPVEPVAHFTGRAEELSRLGWWTADDSVRVVGVTACGGAGKTALVSEWVRSGVAATRPGVRGVFGWSFYADASAERWVERLAEWAQNEFEIDEGSVSLGDGTRPADLALAVLQSVPLVVVLDGLEVVQEPGGGDSFGRFLDGTLREVLTRACRAKHQSLVVLTSRFPFADLEGFDGGSARMLDVPPFTPDEGSTLLAAVGGEWLGEADRRGLVADVDGHALAVAVLGGILADQGAVVDVAGLREELATQGRTDTRVGRVIRLYADRLGEADRFLVGAISLFAHPVTPEDVLAVAGHEVFASHLEGATPAAIHKAVEERLSGLVAMHPDGTISAHPLVREAFRPLVMGAADIAAETTLDGIPGEICSREDGERVVEAIELLLDAGQWQTAHSLYSARTRDGMLWMFLPALRLGMRAALAFVGTPTRRACFENQLPARQLTFYLNEVGLYSVCAGDPDDSIEYLEISVDHARALGDFEGLSTALLNLAECKVRLGRMEGARACAAEALSHDQTIDREREWRSRCHLAWTADLAGDVHAAEEQFGIADRILRTAVDDDYLYVGDHLYGVAGIWWGEFLARTGRAGQARVLTTRNRQVSSEQGWNENVARCDRLLAKLDLASDASVALTKAALSARVFRDGDFLTELAETLPVLAEVTRVSGDLDVAYDHAAEAIGLAGPRGLIPAQVAALAARARICVDRLSAAKEPSVRATHLARGRDDAEAARRLASSHRLLWHELEALDVQVRLDTVAGQDHGWTAKAAALRTRLAPGGLDPDPLVTIEGLGVKDNRRRGD